MGQKIIQYLRFFSIILVLQPKLGILKGILKFWREPPPKLGCPHMRTVFGAPGTPVLK